MFLNNYKTFYFKSNFKLFEYNDIEVLSRYAIFGIKLKTYKKLFQKLICLNKELYILKILKNNLELLYL